MSKGWHGRASSPAFIRQSWSNVSIPFRNFFLLPDFETCEELYYPDVPFLWQEQQEEAQANNDDGNYSDTVEDNFTRVVINNCVGHWTGVITWERALGQYPLPSPSPPQLWGLAVPGEHDHGDNDGKGTISCWLSTQQGMLTNSRGTPAEVQGLGERGISISLPCTAPPDCKFFLSPWVPCEVRNPSQAEPSMHSGGIEPFGSQICQSSAQLCVHLGSMKLAAATCTVAPAERAGVWELL